MKNILQTWEIELLTPLHIGDGQMLRENQDFTVETNAVSVYGLDQVLSQIKDNPAMISDICANGLNIQELKTRYRLRITPVYTIPVAGGMPRREIRRFLKDAFLRPYLPGSTLKGAVHTSLWVSLDRSKLPKVDRSNQAAWRSFRREVERLQGQDPHHSFIRPLKITDSEALVPKDALCVQEIKFFNLIRDGKGGWKSFEGGGNPTHPDHRTARGVFVEALKPGTKLICQVALDGFLLDGKVKNLADYPPCKGVGDFGALLGQINSHSLEMAYKERDFFSKHQAPQQVIMFYENLIKKISDLNDKGVAYLRLAWGSGWKGMTGDWMTPEQFEAARAFERFGRIVGAIFPKTRRLAVKDGVPCLPLGWVRIRPVEQRVLNIHKPVPDTVKPGESPVDVGSQAPQQTKQGDHPEPSMSREIWERATLSYNPGRKEFTVNYQGKKATFKEEALLPSSIAKRVVEKRQPTTVKVEVESQGNFHKVIKVEA